MKLRLQDGSEANLPTEDRKAARYLADVVARSGRLPEDADQRADWSNFAEKYLLAKDAITSSEIRPLLQSAMQILIREPVEPLITITNLYTRVNARGLDVRVLAGAIGAVVAGDVQEHGTYPEVMFQLGGGMQTAYIGKSGIAAAFTDEALRYSTWDIMAQNLRLMGAALVRHKEQKAVSFLKELGTELYNNVTPSTSAYGVCTGRGLDMAANGSMTMDDLFQGMAHMSEEGFTPNIMLVNPIMFYMWLQDPVLRNLLLAHGGGAYFQRWNGTVGPLDPWSNGAIGGLGASLGNRVTPHGNPAGDTPNGIEGREHGMTSTPTIPGYFPWQFSVMASPFVPYDPETHLSDIYLLSSGNVGYYLVDEDPVTVEWRDENVEVNKVKIRERYGFGVGWEGMGIGVYKNVPVRRNYWDGTISASTLDVNSEIAADTDLSSVL